MYRSAPKTTMIESYREDLRTEVMKIAILFCFEVSNYKSLSFFTFRDSSSSSNPKNRLNSEEKHLRLAN